MAGARLALAGVLVLAGAGAGAALAVAGAAVSLALVLLPFHPWLLGAVAIRRGDRRRGAHVSRPGGRLMPAAGTAGSGR